MEIVFMVVFSLSLDFCVQRRIMLTALGAGCRYFRTNDGAGGLVFLRSLPRPKACTGGVGTITA
eukprot:2525404-Prymnesium_polylepis.1